MIFSEILKTPKYLQKTPRNQQLKKSYKETSNENSSENKLELELNNFKNAIFKNFEN